MATGVYLPIWGMQMEEGKVVNWLVAEGDRVEKGDPLVEIETEKITNVVEAPEAGIIARIVAPEGAIVKITGLLAVIAREEEGSAAVEAVVAGSGMKVAETGRIKVVRPEGPAPEPPRQSGEVRASPVAKRMAQEHHIDLALLKGTGPEGRIVKEDVLAAIEAAQGAAKSEPVAAAAAGVPAPAAAAQAGFDGVIVPLSQTRKVIARRTLESIKAPQGTLTREVDLSEFLKFRKSIMNEFEKRNNVRLGLTPMFVKAAALAIKEVPIINSRLDDDKVYISNRAHVGVVVGLDGAIVIPVVFNADLKSLAEIARDWQDLSTRAAKGALKLSEITGGTFTISNVGNAGIDVFTPIINPPEAAVLGITRTRRRPIVRDGTIDVGEMTYLCLTGDHRVMDAEPIGRFLTALEAILLNPVALLL